MFFSFKVYARGIHSRLSLHIPTRIRRSARSAFLAAFQYSVYELLFCSSWFVVMAVRFLSSLNIKRRVLCPGMVFYSTRTVRFQWLRRCIAPPTFENIDNELSVDSIAWSSQVVPPPSICPKQK